MKTFSKLFLILGLAFILMAFLTPKTAMSTCDPDVPFLTTVDYPGSPGTHNEGYVTFQYPWKDNYYIDIHCGLNPLMRVDPCNPWTLQFYVVAWEQKPGGDSVKLLNPKIHWPLDSCQWIEFEYVFPVGYVVGTFADSIVMKVTMKPKPIAGCTGFIPFQCQMPPYQTVFLDCWRDCWDELLEIEAQDDCTPANSAICRIEWDKPLPVELISFTSSVKDNTVTLNWTTASEENNARFIIQRKSDAEWTDAGNVAGNGTTGNLSNYLFKDKNVNSGLYNYRLKQVDYNGNFEYLNLNGTVAVGIPDKFSLAQNYPNPFNPTTTIVYGLPNDGKVTLKIYDMNGREVKTLVNEPQSAGYYTTTFNAAGLSSGVYFYKLESGNFVSAKKMVILK